MKLGHVHLKVRDLESAERFYGSVLGFRVTERVANRFVFMSLGTAHHDLALQRVDGERPDADAVGLYHVAFEVENEEEFTSVVERLQQVCRATSLVDHGISWAIYGEDPAGNGVEVYLDRRASNQQTWQGRSRELTV